MGANVLLAYIPAAKITKPRRRVLHRLVHDLSTADLDNEEFVSLADDRDVRQMLHEYVDLLPADPGQHRDVAEMALPHMPYRVLFTGGPSWGDSPCDLFDSFCCLGALPAIVRQLRDWALEEEKSRKSKSRPRQFV
jgi:hypothetical protein